MEAPCPDVGAGEVAGRDDRRGGAPVTSEQIDQALLPLRGGGRQSLRSTDFVPRNVREPHDPAACVADVAEACALSEHHVPDTRFDWHDGLGRVPTEVDQTDVASSRGSWIDGPPDDRVDSVAADQEIAPPPCAIFEPGDDATIRRALDVGESFPVRYRDMPEGGLLLQDSG
jgi:hypothetical protein